jgi:hypothetical protein
MKFHYIILIFILIILQGCGILDDDGDDNAELQPLEGSLVLEVREQYNSYNEVTDPVLYLLLRTEKIYPCYNYGIASSLQIDPGRIEITLYGVVAPDICLTALGPARSQIKLNIPDGTYQLIFRAAAFTDQYRLIINKSSVKIERVNSTNTSILHSLYHRYPEKSFVYLCGTTLEDTALCRMFIDTVAAVIKIDQFEFPETGVIPYNTASQGYHYNMPAKFFYYQSESDYDKIESIMKSFKDIYIRDKQGIGIQVTNWRNKTFNSSGI